MVADPDGSIVYWDSGAEKLYDWPASEAIGRNFFEFAGSNENADWAAVTIERVGAGERWRGELPVRRRDGTTVTAAVTVTPALDKKGNVRALVVVSRDATETHRASAQLVTSEHRFEALVRGSEDTMMVLDPEGVITFVDGPIGSPFGNAPELLGRNVFSILVPDDRERARALFDQQLSTTTMVRAGDFWIERLDGTWSCVSIVTDNLLDDPAIGGIVLTARDITEHKNLERARVAVSGANTALVRAMNEGDLFDELCRVVTNDATYRMAWIGILDPARPLGVRIVAYANDSSHYVAAMEELTGSGSYEGPLAVALRTKELVVVEDLETLPESPWRQLALQNGFRSLIALPLVVSESDFGVLAIYSEHANAFTLKAVEVLTELTGDLSYGVEALRTRAERVKYQARFEGSLEAAIRAMATTAELRDPYTAGHQRRVAELADAIATELGFDAEFVRGVRTAASVHDIGKLAVPSDILSRPGTLSEAEFALIRVHPQAGHDILVGIEFSWPIAETVLQHHERLDGSGYPRGLHGEEVSMGARVIAIADTVEAITSHRPYRPAIGVAKALEVIRAGRGTLFDPDVVDSCCRLLEERSFTFTP
jgi:PAS domain S-box-containing protein